MRRSFGTRASTTVALVLVLLLPACGSKPARKVSAPAPPTTRAAPPPTTVPAPTTTVPAYPTAVAAVANDDVSSVAIYEAPTDAEPSHTLSNPNPFYVPAFPRLFLVQE